MSTDVAIIGAGPYGLAVAAELRRLRIPFRIFGSPMETWNERMPAQMHLKSEGFASNIGTRKSAPTLAGYCREHGIDYGDVGVPVSRDVFSAYGCFIQNAVAPHLERTRVRRLDHDGERFTLDLESGEAFNPSHVVVATGLNGHAFVPDSLAAAAPSVSHSSDHSDFTAFAGRKVAVVGGGQSALETAHFLAQAGAVTSLVARTPALTWNRPPGTRRGSTIEQLARPLTGIGVGWRAVAAERLPQAIRLLPRDKRYRVAFGTLGPAGAWWLRDQFDRDRVDLRLGSTIASVEPGKEGTVRLILGSSSGSDTLDVDHVIAATGYRYSLDRLGILTPSLRGQLRRVGTAPWLSTSFETTVRRLYFVGFAATSVFGPAMRFVCGTPAAAAISARAIRRTSSGRRPADS